MDKILSLKLQICLKFEYLFFAEDASELQLLYKDLCSCPSILLKW